jgi:hypothetical protein
MSFCLAAAASGQVQPALASTFEAADWPTWSYDAERTVWNRGEKTLSKNNVGKLRFKWKMQLPVPVVDVVISTATAPMRQGVSCHPRWSYPRFRNVSNANQPVSLCATNLLLIQILISLRRLFDH